MNIGQNVKNLRVKNGLTQKDLAEKLNVTPQAVSRWENDTVEPSIDTIKEMSILFNVSVNEILGTKDPVKEEKKVEKQNISVIGICDSCKKPLHPGEGELRSRGGKNSSHYYICNDCANKELEARAYVISETNKKYRSRGLIFGSIGFVVMLIIMLIIASSVKENGDKLLYLGLSFPISLMTFTFIFCIFMRNNFIGETWLEIVSWSFVKFPGIIFSFDLDGFLFLIGLKILFFILGILLIFCGIVFATIVCGIASLFVFPFSIYWSFNREDKTEIKGL